MLNKENTRELAYVVTVDAIEPLPGYDRVETAIVGGWRCIVRLNQFKPGDPAIYFEIDSVLPQREPFLFLEKRNFRIKTQKMCKSISEGLLMSLEDFHLGPDTPEWVDDLEYKIKKGIDVAGIPLTKAIGVKHYETPEERRSRKPVDRIKVMKSRYPKVCGSFLGKWLLNREWGANLLLKFFGTKKTNNKRFPTHFPYIKVTDSERCVIGATKILTDQGSIPISKIVNNKLPVKVLSMNPDGTTSFKKILDYQNYLNEKEIITLEYPYRVGVTRKNHLCCTLDHKILTSNGYVKAEDIKVGDKVFGPVECYGEDVLPIIYGMLLGDSSVSNDRRCRGTLRVSTVNGEAQLDYLKYKQSIFNGGEGSICESGIGKFKNAKMCYKFSLPADPYISECLRRDLYINDRKTVTPNLIDKLTEASLAFWYMDDGCLSNRSKEKGSPFIRLNSQGFTKEENELLSECLNKKFGIECHPTQERRPGKPIYYHIYITTRATKKFLEIVTPYMCKSMAYKTLPELEEFLQTKEIKCYKNKKVLEMPVTKVELGQHKNKSLPETFSIVYDLEVEDNHNFIADGIVVHNCENLPHLLNEQEKTKWIVTAKCDGSSATYILERKPFNRFKFWVISRRVVQLKEEQECYFGDRNYYWEVAKKYDIENCLKDYLKKNKHLDYVCWQGEICAPGIQKNPHKLKETHFYAFHMIDSEQGMWDIRNAKKVWDFYGMESVPIVDEDYILPEDMETFKQYADGCYPPEVCEGNPKCPREGFVFYDTKNPSRHFKNVSRKYLLKQN